MGQRGNSGERFALSSSPKDRTNLLHRFACVEKMTHFTDTPAIPFLVPNRAGLLSPAYPPLTNGGAYRPNPFRKRCLRVCDKGLAQPLLSFAWSLMPLFESPVERLVTVRNVRYSRSKYNNKIESY